MAALKSTRLLRGRFRLGNALGLLLVQDQAAAKSNCGAIRRQHLEGLKNSVISLICTQKAKSSLTRSCLCKVPTPYSSYLGIAPATCSGDRPSPWCPNDIRSGNGSSVLFPQILQLRNYCTDQSKQQQVRTQNEKSDDKIANIEEEKKDVAEEEQHVGIFKRFKDAYKEYGKVLICVHVATSAVWFSAFYYAAYSGVDIIPLLKSLGFSETLIKPFAVPGVGHAAVAYLMYKLATPARYTVTIGGTQITVRQLRRMGYMEPVPEGHSIRDLAKVGASQMKEKYGDLKDDVKDKYTDLKGDVKDKYSDLRVDVKEKYSDIKVDVKDKFTDFKGDLKNKVEELQNEEKQDNRETKKK